MPAVVIERNGGFCVRAPKDVQDKAKAEAAHDREIRIAARNKIAIDDDPGGDGSQPDAG